MIRKGGCWDFRDLLFYPGNVMLEADYGPLSTNRMKALDVAGRHALSGLDRQHAGIHGLPQPDFPHHLSCHAGGILYLAVFANTFRQLRTPCGKGRGPLQDPGELNGKIKIYFGRVAFGSI